ncbi:hypothetical protein RM543_08885 [Roseicyclus sp. F158]|uniref:Uncharacterized protein n=1 Tax=Tropicimonas omnivorans TaxID=3075590 RepID=A0ABU3DGI7_9RHOB|nr:hypothetical protein [Roseicyclus sp. F158]MDT0682800.1 hypothetical protein [Roseicyclus sp. F158]
MSAPHTDVEKQEKQHRPAMMGIGFAILWGVVLLAVFIVFMIWRGEEPVEAETQIDGRTGAVEEPAEGAATDE